MTNAPVLRSPNTVSTSQLRKYDFCITTNLEYVAKAKNAGSRPARIAMWAKEAAWSTILLEGNSD